MTSEIIRFFAIQRNIFGICPRSGQFFRLSDCKIYLKTKPKKDWLDKIDAEAFRLDMIEERLEEKEESLREKARSKGRRIAQRAIRRIDSVFSPRHLNPDDAKVIFHPVDYVVFSGMKNSGSIKKIVFLDREVRSNERNRLQRSIEKVIEKDKYEWLTMRVLEDGSIREE